MKGVRWELEVKGHPLPKARPRHRRGSSAVYTPKESLAWQQQIGAAWFDKYKESLPSTDRYYLSARFVFNTWCHSDLDNLLGGVMDAHIVLGKKEKIGIFENDRSVCSISGRIDVDPDAEEGVKVVILPWSEIFSGDVKAQEGG